MAVDPLAKKYPYLTPYQFASNTPIWARELEGAEAQYSTGDHEEDPFSGEKTAGGEKTNLAGPLSEGYSQEQGVGTSDEPASKFGKSASVEVMTGSISKEANVKDKLNNFLERGGLLGGHASIKTNEGIFGFTGGDKLKTTAGKFLFSTELTKGEQYVSFPLDISLDQYNGIVDTYIDRDKFNANAGKKPFDEGYTYFLKVPGYDYGPIAGFRCASSCLKVLNDNKVIQDSEFRMKFIDAPTPQALIRYLQDKKFDYSVTPANQLNPNELFNNNFHK